MNQIKNKKTNQKNRKIDSNQLIELFNLENMFSREWVNKNMWFLLFLTFLSLGYIFNVHHSEKNVRKINRLEKEIHVLKGESASLQLDLEQKRKRSSVSYNVKKLNLGLEESKTPPRKIYKKKK